MLVHFGNNLFDQVFENEQQNLKTFKMKNIRILKPNISVKPNKMAKTLQ